MNCKLAFVSYVLLYLPVADTAPNSMSKLRLSVVFSTKGHSLCVYFNRSVDRTVSLLETGISSYVNLLFLNFVGKNFTLRCSLIVLVRVVLGTLGSSTS